MIHSVYYAALLPRRGPHIASHSLCPSVPLSSVTSRHLANYNDTHVLFDTRWGPHILRPSRPHQILVKLVKQFNLFCHTWSPVPRYTRTTATRLTSKGTHGINLTDNLFQTLKGPSSIANIFNNFFNPLCLFVHQCNYVVIIYTKCHNCCQCK